MTARRWRPNGFRPLPAADEALRLPFPAFPSWFLRFECGRCGQAWILNEALAPQRDVVADLLAYARHEGCGGQAAKAARLNTNTRVGGRPVRLSQRS